jgi:citrate lyase beta subunit
MVNNQMLIVSQNITHYDLSMPENAIFRINLAWVNSISELEILLKSHQGHSIFIDLPINRTKPPNNRYSLEDIIEIIKNNQNIKYFAISNVESKHDLAKYLEILPKSITLVPKIESYRAVENILEIANALDYQSRVFMLDHDDLYSNLLKSNISPDKFTFYINQLSEFCKLNKITLLRTIGVLFSDEEKRISDYVN